MQEYQRAFIKLAMHKDVLRFGTFTLKSHRISPYFFIYFKTVWHYLHWVSVMRRQSKNQAFSMMSFLALKKQILLSG